MQLMKLWNHSMTKKHRRTSSKSWWFRQKTDGTANNTSQIEQEDEVDEDMLISDMVDKLQDWRVMNQESPFES